MSNVLTWRTALDGGFEPRHYPYAVEDVPIGIYEAVLDCKIWAKNTMGISCYFTRLDNGHKFRMTVFRRKDDEVYALPGAALDFKESPLDAKYLLTVERNSKGNMVFKNAEVLT